MTVLVPAFDEAGTVGLVLEKLLSLPIARLDVIVVDDGSNDGTRATAEAIARKSDRVQVLSHERNRGKGAAIRTALPYARGDLVVIQDADLENDPRDLIPMLARFADPGTEVVYGSRWIRPGLNRRGSSWFAARILAGAASCLFGTRVSDLPTAYKMFRASVLRGLDLKETRFGFCAEVTARALTAGHRISEVPISFRPRTRRQGKKIRWKDGLRALGVLLRVRLQARPEGRRHRSAEGRRVSSGKAHSVGDPLPCGVLGSRS